MNFLQQPKIMQKYSIRTPFLAKIKEKKLLSKPGSCKKVYNLVFDISSSEITYQTGDCVAILPQNDPSQVKEILNTIKISPKEIIVDRRSKQNFSVEDFLLKKANLSLFSSSLLKILSQHNGKNAKKLREVLVVENKTELQSYIHKRDVLQLLKEQKESKISAQELCDNLLFLLPRLYSIASSQSSYPEEIHVLFGYVSYSINNKIHYGTTSHYLCDLAKVNTSLISIYLHKTKKFTLPPDNNANIIMIGPGTGLAPFLSFLQERKHQKANGKNWLFFGECNKKYDFYYEDFFSEMIKEKKLILDTAFSRDQSEKIYVQHKIAEKGKELWSWIEKGAYLYVCGDAKKMAKDVEHIMLEIIKKFGKKNENDALLFLKELNKKGRYVKEVY
jgi:sulfite reductase (NADPH) flavoprotein alpha-component